MTATTEQRCYSWQDVQALAKYRLHRYEEAAQKTHISGLVANAQAQLAVIQFIAGHSGGVKNLEGTARIQELGDNILQVLMTLFFKLKVGHPTRSAIANILTLSETAPCRILAELAQAAIQRDS